jgi:hypothetical protein
MAKITAEPLSTPHYWCSQSVSEEWKRRRNMAALVGGIVATIIGVVLLVVWWKYFLVLLAGGIPLILVLGGALAIYIGIDEIKDKMQQGPET